MRDREGHGATRGIAERIAQTLQDSGHDVTLQPADRAANVEHYDAFVVGSAAYAWHWLKEATNFVRRNSAVLASRPAWLFSSGPIDSENRRDFTVVEGQAAKIRV